MASFIILIPDCITQINKRQIFVMKRVILSEESSVAVIKQLSYL